MGLKNDAGKLRFDLINPNFLHAIAYVLTQGAVEYGDENWKDVEPARYDAALERHWNAYRRGQYYDPKSRVHHLVHVAVNAMFLALHPKR